jgi:hypothetical protein
MNDAGHLEATNDVPPVRDALILRLLQEHEMACPVCSQLLRGMTTPRCTECGASIRLQLTAPEARMHAWLVAVIALALPFGFASMFGLMLLVFGVATGSHEPGTVLLCFIVAALSGPALGVLLRRRHRFFGLNPTAQHAWAAGSITLSLILAALLLQAAVRA